MNTRRTFSIITCIIALTVLPLVYAACTESSSTSTGTDDGGDAVTDGGTGGELSPCSWTTPPAKGVPCTDPDYGTSITRITDKAVDGYAGPGIENEYARSDPENSDGTMVVLRGNDGEWYVYDAATFGMIRHLNIISIGGEEPEPRWDATDPHIFYFFDGPLLRRYDVVTDTSSTVHDFSPAAYITTKNEGDASLDRRYWCLMLEDGANNVMSLVVYDRTADAVIGQLNPPYKDGINWVSMDMSGNHCVIGYEDSDTDGDDQTPPVDVFNRSFGAVATLPAGSTGHMDLAMTADMKDVVVYQNNATDWIAMADLATGTETNLVQIPFNVNPDIGLHFSGNNSATPGWVLISTYNSFNPPPGMSHSWMDNLLFLVELKDSPTIRNLAHTNAYTSLDFSGVTNYFAEAFAAINKSGTRVYYGSNWRNYTPDYSDTYMLRIP